LINRFSSRRQMLGHSFLNSRLNKALSYDRIAGYFRSSLLEVAGEALESMTGAVRIVCNSDLNLRDVETARAAQYAMRQEWCEAKPEKIGMVAQPRFARLYDFLTSGKLQVRVMPREKFGLIHGKAGVITLADGQKTSFLGSANETGEAWQTNYELLWEDDSLEAVEWVQEEFDALWHSPFAVPLAEFVVEDIGRLARRSVISSVVQWREEAEPAAPVIEAPVYRREYGLWEHQKYFIQLAFEAHRSGGARLVLADMVGLGKTVQLALAAQLMALYGNRPVLVLVPKQLLWQWQDEMRDLLDMPSAVWTGRQWVDENGIEYQVMGPEGIKKCPRRVGIVSQGLITSRSEAVEYLKLLSYECIIVDEAHRARRKNLGPGKEDEKPEPNNLLSFLYSIAPRTKSLMLATATPVQLNPVEAWDLLDILSRDNEKVLGNPWSNWRRAGAALHLVMGKSLLPEDGRELWSWIRNPLPPTKEHLDFHLIRRTLKMPDEQAVAPPEAWEELGEPGRSRVRRLARTFTQNHNPFIRHIIRRTRDFLEETIDPETNEPYLKKVEVVLLGEKPEDAIRLPAYLREAYDLAGEFCELLGTRVKAAGFLKTLLLRRVGSTIFAGRQTAEKMLRDWQSVVIEHEEDDESAVSEMKKLTAEERQLLERFVAALNSNPERDPKYDVVLDLLKKGWLELGCIVFSQYYDSIDWLARNLSLELPGEKIGIYAGNRLSGIMHGSEFINISREEIKGMVARGAIRLLLGTDAASEGLNLQRLGSLINLDLPWNPTRLEQRKGRIQRIGQLKDKVYIYNLRYKNSVEDRVHELLSSRMKEIYEMFGQIPDVLEDVWVHTALGEIEQANKTIDAVYKQHPFEIKYNQIRKVPWESCAKVLDAAERRKYLKQGW
jgi:ERCC4-related helicase